MPYLNFIGCNYALVQKANTFKTFKLIERLLLHVTVLFVGAFRTRDKFYVLFIGTLIYIMLNLTTILYILK